MSSIYFKVERNLPDIVMERLVSNFDFILQAIKVVNRNNILFSILNTASSGNFLVLSKSWFSSCLLLHYIKNELISVLLGEITEDGKQRVCDSLIMCIITSLNHGLRNGGGIGDLLRKPHSKVKFQNFQLNEKININACNN